jgi:RNA polymerase sigma factor (sigma-70 family)
VQVKKEYKKDMKLVAACLQNNEKAWKQFIHRFRPSCRIIAIHFNCLKDFDDLFSDFILKLLGSSSGKPGVLQKYRPCVALNTFLSTVFRNMLIDHLRSSNHKEHVMNSDTPIEIAFPAQTSVPGFTKEVEYTEIERFLLQAVKNLTAYEQRLVDLYYFHELPVRQVAQVLNCSKSKIARDLHGIHTRLRKHLDEKNIEW